MKWKVGHRTDVRVDNPDAGNIVDPHVLVIHDLHQIVTCSVIFNKENTFDMIHVTEIWIVETNWKHGFHLKAFGAF